MIPEEWSVKQIGELVDRKSVGRKYSQKTAQPEGHVPILDQGKSGIIGYHDDEPGVIASPDDPIIVFANHTCYMRLIMHDFSAIQNVLPFKGKGLNIFWMYCATYGQQEFLEYKGHWPDFVLREIPVPKEDVTDAFGEIVNAMFKEQFESEQQSRTLAELRDTLLPKLLSGEISVTQAQNAVEAAVDR